MPQETTVDAALREVDELLLGENSILLQIRARQGLDRARFDQLVKAIEVLIAHYRHRSDVPKQLALAFVDISNYFYYKEDYYPMPVLIELEDAAHKLSYLAQELFSAQR
jgi:hypothetical protein